MPGTDGYADVPLTVYLRSATAPEFFERIENVPELTARYRSVELAFHKRYSHGWQLFGSLAWNRATGTTTMASRWSAGNAPSLLTPNAFTNISAEDILLQDRPLVARLGATAHFGRGIFASVLFKAQSGAPWGRTVTVLPPSDWAATHGAVVAPVTVYLESPGARRHDGWKNLDLRLEKEFAKGGRVPFGISVDVFNLLGDKYRPLRPQRRRDLVPRRRRRRDRDAGPQRHLQRLPASVGDAGRPDQPRPKILAGTRRPSSAPRPRPRS
ncbi:MAG: hypothetical protein MZV65_53265 [Chromatiales bacterium]|nr:hypothetical protein [Chromatiales bacterium]